MSIPGWAGQWFSIFPNVRRSSPSCCAVGIVVGSYFAAQYVRVWRPRRGGVQVAQPASRPPRTAVAISPLAQPGSPG